MVACLVHEVWPLEALFDRGRVLAEELASQPAVAVSAMLRAIVGAEDRTLAENIALEREAVLRTMGTPDQQEGMMAFLEKRRPRFNR